MNNHNYIQVFEHQRLTTDDSRFSTKHLNALLKLNELHEFKYFEAIPKGIKFNQYVGIIQIDSLSIEILPKADIDDEDNKWQNVLLQMLTACGKLKASSAGAANVKRTNLNLLEVYFNLFLQEINILIRQGLVKQYSKETNNVKALKGKLEFAGNIRKNLVHKERFYTTHQVYDQNHLLHQILKTALDIIAQFSKGSYLNDACKRVSLNFPEVSTTKITKKVLDNVTLTRKTKSYEYALELARLIILNYSPDISSGKEKMLSLLFDMNNLWEQYILTQLKKQFEETVFEVSGQESMSFIASNSLRPDIVIRNTETQSIYVVDTKWKRPKNIAQVSDLRQMYTYARFWNAEKVMLLYPGEEKENNFEKFETEDFSLFNDCFEPKEIKHLCKLGFVSVVNYEGNLDGNIGHKIFKLIEVENYE